MKGTLRLSKVWGLLSPPLNLHPSEHLHRPSPFAYLGKDLYRMFQLPVWMSEALGHLIEFKFLGLLLPSLAPIHPKFRVSEAEMASEMSMFKEFF